MNISTRITEYSITGGLLWVNVLLFATLANILPGAITLDNAAVVWGAWIEALEPLKATLERALPPALQGSLATLLGALLIIVIFFSGILLDLIAPLFFVPLELFFFRKWLIEKNRGWLDALAEAHRDFIRADYYRFVGGRVIDWRHPLAWFEQRRCFHKLSAFLLSHIMVSSPGAALDELTDRIHLWRTSRAISTSIVVLGCLLNFTSVIAQKNAAGVALISVGIPLALFLASYVITLSTYSRMCLYLASLAYFTTHKAAPA